MTSTGWMATTVLATVVGAASCGGNSNGVLFTPKEVDRQDKAASAHIAILTVASWDKYRDALQPTFKLTPEEALALAVPNTMALEERFLSAFAAKMKLALPTTVTSTVTATHAETGKEPTTTRDSTTTEASGDASSVAVGAAPEGARTAAGLPTTGVLTTPLGVGSMLRYLAATAIYQEVQTLGFHVKEAALREGFTPYVVRMQVSLLPLARDEPYDAYTLASFFQGEWASGGEDLKMLLTSGVDGSDTEQEPTDRCDGKGRGSSPSAPIYIVPLLVTDDLEATTRSRSLDDLRQVAIGLSAMLSGAGLDTDIQSTDEQLSTVAGRDLNSTFTVARVSHNSVVMRFGAMNQAGARYAMVPRTHSVTLLVLLPRELATTEDVAARTVRVTARTTLVHATKGTELPGRNLSDVYTAAAKVLADHDITLDARVPADLDAIKRIYGAVTANDYLCFVYHAETATKRRVSFPESLWVDLVNLRRGSQYSTADLIVPRIQVVQPTKAQTAILTDDGKATTATTLRGGVGLDGGKLAARLVVKAPTPVELAALSLKVTEGREVALTFPSLQSLGLADKTKVLHPVELHLDTVGGAGTQYATFYRPTASPDPTPSFKMTIRAKAIVREAGGKGVLRIQFHGSKDAKAPIHFTISGADVEGKPTNAEESKEDDGWTVSTNTTVVVQLRNLSTTSPVTVVATDTNNKSKHAPVTLQVVEDEPKEDDD